MPYWAVHFELHLDLSDLELHRLVVEAEALARAVNGIPVSPAIRAHLDRLNIARSVRATTGIEGAQLTEPEVQQILRSASTDRVLPASREREEQEARNAAEVMKHVATVLDADRETPLTEQLICTLHELTTNGIAYEHNEPGKYRSHPAAAGDYVPPRTHDEIRELMRGLIRWANEPPASQWPPVLRAIAAHFYLVSIHPFGDGNGRTARALESFLLYQARMNALGFYSLANYYYQHRSEYIRMLDYTRFESGGEITSFVRFGLKGLVSELQGVYDEVIAEATATAFRDYAREAIGAIPDIRAPLRERLIRFVQSLGREPVRISTISSGAHPSGAPYRSLSERTLRRDIDVLEELELVRNDGGQIQANLDIVRRYTSRP